MNEDIGEKTYPRFPGPPYCSWHDRNGRLQRVIGPEPVAAKRRPEETAVQVPTGREMLQPYHALALKSRPRSSDFSDTTQSQRHHQARLAIDFVISNVFGIETGALWRGTRGVRNIASARQVAMYLAHVVCGMTLTEVGMMFGRDRTTVAYACLKVEVRRDDPIFDRALDLLGWALPTLVSRAKARSQTH